MNYTSRRKTNPVFEKFQSNIHWVHVLFTLPQIGQSQSMLREPHFWEETFQWVTQDGEKPSSYTCISAADEFTEQWLHILHPWVSEKYILSDHANKSFPVPGKVLLHILCCQRLEWALRMLLFVRVCNCRLWPGNMMCKLLNCYKLVADDAGWQNRYNLPPLTGTRSERVKLFGAEEWALLLKG